MRTHYEKGGEVIIFGQVSFITKSSENQLENFKKVILRQQKNMGIYEISAEIQYFPHI